MQLRTSENIESAGRKGLCNEHKLVRISIHLLHTVNGFVVFFFLSHHLNTIKAVNEVIFQIF